MIIKLLLVTTFLGAIISSIHLFTAGSGVTGLTRDGIIHKKLNCDYGEGHAGLLKICTISSQKEYIKVPKKNYDHRNLES